MLGSNLRRTCLRPLHSRIGLLPLVVLVQQALSTLHTVAFSLLRLVIRALFSLRMALVVERTVEQLLIVDEHLGNKLELIEAGLILLNKFWRLSE